MRRAENGWLDSALQGYDGTLFVAGDFGFLSLSGVSGAYHSAFRYAMYFFMKSKQSDCNARTTRI